MIFNIACPFLSNVSFQAKEKAPYAEATSLIVLLSIPDSLNNWRVFGINIAVKMALYKALLGIGVVCGHL